jgi:ankyrin repeat protein
MLHQIDFGYLPGVRWFLDHGADPDVRHPCGLTALHWAIMRPGTSEMVELLLERGADAGARTSGGATALDLAERHHGKTDAVVTLERHGATRSRRGPLDELVVAAAYGDEARARSILSANPGLLGELGEDDRRLVAAFAEAGNREGAIVLARVGFDMSRGSWMGMTPLHWAACRGNSRMLRELLEQGAPVVRLDGFGTPLHTALHQRWSSFGHRAGESDYPGVLQALLEGGVEIPPDLGPCGDAELDALVVRARADERARASADATRAPAFCACIAAGTIDKISL